MKLPVFGCTGSIIPVKREVRKLRRFGTKTQLIMLLSQEYIEKFTSGLYNITFNYFPLNGSFKWLVVYDKNSKKNLNHKN